MKKVMMTVHTWIEPYRTEDASVVLGFFPDHEARRVVALLREKYPPAPPLTEKEIQEQQTWEQQLRSQRDRLSRYYPDGCIRDFWVVDARSGDPKHPVKCTSMEAALEKAAYADYCKDEYEERCSFVSS